MRSESIEEVGRACCPPSNPLNDAPPLPSPPARHAPSWTAKMKATMKFFLILLISSPLSTSALHNNNVTSLNNIVARDAEGNIVGDVTSALTRTVVGFVQVRLPSRRRPNIVHVRAHVHVRLFVR